MKVYAVLGFFEDDLVEIFSTREKADKYVKDHHLGYVEEREVL